MIWMLLGVGTMLPGAASAASSKDSAALAELRNRLPEDLRIRIEKTRKAYKMRHDTLAKLTPAERNQWLDSLRREAGTRRTQMLDNLSPEDRERMEMRLNEMERQVEPKPPGTPSPNQPSQGYRQ